MKDYICTVCGYVHKASVHDANFRCPMCRVPASKFVERQNNTMKEVATARSSANETLIRSDSDAIMRLRSEAKKAQSDKVADLLSGKSAPLASDLLKGKKLSVESFVRERKRYTQRIVDQNAALTTAMDKARQAEQEAIKRREEEERQARIQEETRRREEEARWREERRRAEAAKQAERELMEQRRRKIRKAVTAAVCTVAAIGLVIFLVVLFTSIIPSNRYEKALQLYEAGNYGEAYKIFDSLGNFNDSRDYAEEALPKWQNQAYREALNHYNKGKFQEAENLFSELGDYRNSKRYLNDLTVVKSMQKYHQASIGDEIEFGTRPGNYNRSEAPLSWILVDKKDGKALLLLENCIAKREFHEYTMADPTWEHSTIREWLNEGFVDDYFGEEELAVIPFTSLENPDNLKYGTDSGNPTNDMFFLLSHEEVSNYFPDESSRYVGMIDSPERKVSWLLRTKGENSHYVMFVNEDGTFNYEGETVFELTGSHGIRPAVWIEIGECEIYDEDMALLEGNS